MSRDKRRFIVRYGVIGVGLPVGIVWAIVKPLWAHTSGSYTRELLIDLLSGVPVFLCGGALWGWIMWRWMEARRHRRR